MHYGFRVTTSGPFLRDLAARPTRALSAVPSCRKSSGRPLRTGLLLEYLLLIMAFSPAASGSTRGGELLPVAYSFPARTRLGLSPKGAFDRAYHNMTANAGGKTYLDPDKKSGPATRLASPSPYIHFRSPVKIARFALLDLRVAFLPDLTNDDKALLIPLFRKRTKCMSNLILPSSPFSAIQHRTPISESLGLQLCLEPVKKSPAKPATLEFFPTPEPILDGFVAPSARCAVKGCVFPVPQGHTECHYHELVRSDAVLFQSHQPSHLLSLKAPFGMPDEEVDNSRVQDRQRLAAEREAFILDEPA